MPSVAQQKVELAQKESDVGPLASTAASIAGYAAPGNVLGPIAAGMTGGPIAAGALEGATAGGISGAANNPDSPLGSAESGAIVGGLIGGAGGAIGKGVNAVASKLSPKPPAFNPEEVIATTKAARDAAYAPLKDIAFHPEQLARAHSSAELTPGMAADVTPGFQSMLQKQRSAIANGGNTANDIADYISNLKSVSNAPGSSNGDTQLAGKIGSNLEDLLKQAKPITDQPPGQAYDTLINARLAHQRYAMAENLGEWSRRAEAGAPIGERPLTEAENWYRNKPEKYQTLVDLYQGGKAGFDPTRTSPRTPAPRSAGRSAAWWAAGPVTSSARGSVISAARRSPRT